MQDRRAGRTTLRYALPIEFDAIRAEAPCLREVLEGMAVAGAGIEESPLMVLGVGYEGTDRGQDTGWRGIKP